MWRMEKKAGYIQLVHVVTINCVKNPGINSSPDGALYLNPEVCIPSLLNE